MIFCFQNILQLGFPASSAGKESACKVRDSSSIPGLESSPGEEIDYPFLSFPGDSDSKESPCSEGDLGSIPWLEDPLEEGVATPTSILAWRVALDRGAWWATVPGVAKSWTQQCSTRHSMTSARFCQNALHRCCTFLHFQQKHI